MPQMVVPQRALLREHYFNSYYISTTDVVDAFSLPKMVGYIKSANLFNTYSETDG